METPKEYYYTYYSYEEWGRGYFGSRECKCLPEEDIKYLGSSKDKTFKPKYKIILKDDYATREEAYADEIILQEHYKVVENPHFANKSYQTSTKFYVPKEQRSENGKKGGKKGGRSNKENKTGFCGRSPEKMSEDGKKSGKRTKELGVGIFAQTKEQRIEVGRKVGELAYKLGIGIHGRTKDQIIEDSKKGAKAINSQRWMCTETGFISTFGPLTRYQKARSIDTSKRVRIE
jgi:hypothetical protein